SPPTSSLPSSSPARWRTWPGAPRPAPRSRASEASWRPPVPWGIGSDPRPRPAARQQCLDRARGTGPPYRHRVSDTAGLSTHFRPCHLGEAMCGIAIEVAQGRIRAIRGDAEDPFSRGHVCPKAVALQDVHEDRDRLRRPLRRTATGFEEIGWEEALDEA